MTALPLDIAQLVVPYGSTPRVRSNEAPGDRTRTQANDFEAMFLSSMMQHMFTDIGDEGPLGNAKGVGVWRSMLTDQYAKAFVKAGGIGVANQIYKSLMAHKAAAATTTKVS
jgi:Rod binding domain-containing protein